MRLPCWVLVLLSVNDVLRGRWLLRDTQHNIIFLMNSFIVYALMIMTFSSTAVFAVFMGGRLWPSWLGLASFIS